MFEPLRGVRDHFSVRIYTVNTVWVLRGRPLSVSSAAGTVEHVFAFYENRRKLISMNVFDSSTTLESRCEVVAM